jgi:hypothetical protein
MLPEDAVEQSGIPAVVVTVPPVQKMIDSGIVPVNTICVAVLAVTLPVSMALPVVSSEAYVEMRTKKEQLTLGQLVPSGFVTAVKRTLMTAPADILAAVRCTKGAPLVVLSRSEKAAAEPVVSKLTPPPVVLRPAGVVQPAPVAVVQYKNFIEPTLTAPTLGTVNWNWWLTTPPGFEPPSVVPFWRVRLRAVI